MSLHCACHSCISSEAVKKIFIRSRSIEKTFCKNYFGFSFVALFYHLVSLMSVSVYFFHSSDLSLTKVILGFQIRNIGQRFTKSIFVGNLGWNRYHQPEI